MTAPLRAIHVEDPITPQVRAMLEALGEDPAREGLAQTPARYAKAMRYLAGGYALDVESVLGRGVFAAEGEATSSSIRSASIISFRSTARCTSATCRGAASSDSRRSRAWSISWRAAFNSRSASRSRSPMRWCSHSSPKAWWSSPKRMAMRGVQKQNAVTLTRALRGAHEEIVPLVKGASSRQFSEVESQALHERFARRRPRDRAGIVVNDYLRSADPAIYAVGDVAEVGGWLYPRATLQPRFPGRRRYSPWPSRFGFAVQRQAVAVRV